MFVRYTCDLELPKKLAGCKLYMRYCSIYRKKPVPSTCHIVRRNLIVCFERLNAIVNYVWKTDLQVQNHYVLISYKIYSPSNQTLSAKTNFIFRN